MTRRSVIKAAAVCVVLCLGVVMLLSYFENTLVYPAPRGGTKIASNFGAEDVVFRSADGTRLHGWFVDRGAATSLLFFHGNAESVDGSGPGMSELAQLIDANVFFFDYRGYGKSEGKPSQKGLIEDGIAASLWLQTRTKDATLVYLGRSLGGGVAAQVATKQTPACLIMVSTFSSMVDVGANMMPWLPVRLLMKNTYESANALKDMSVPLFQIHGDTDRIVPIEFGRALHAASPAAKRFVVAKDRGHNDIYLGDYALEIRAFIGQSTQED